MNGMPTVIKCMKNSIIKKKTYINLKPLSFFLAKLKRKKNAKCKMKNSLWQNVQTCFF